MSAIYLLLLKITKTNVPKSFYYGNNLPKALLSGLKICLHVDEAVMAKLRYTLNSFSIDLMGIELSKLN